MDFRDRVGAWAPTLSLLILSPTDIAQSVTIVINLVRRYQPKLLKIDLTTTGEPQHVVSRQYHLRLSIVCFIELVQPRTIGIYPYLVPIQPTTR